MIHTNLSHSEVYRILHPSFERSFDFLSTLSVQNFKPGVFEIDGKNIFIILSERNGIKKEDARLETHRKYIDIQYLIESNETMGWKDYHQCKNVLSPYDDSKDIEFYHDAPSSFFKLIPGELVIFFPNDAHAPMIGGGLIKKAVVKILAHQ